MVFLTKGLASHQGTICLLPAQFHNFLPSHLKDKIPLSAIGGPSIAAEVNLRRPTSIVLVGTDLILLETIAEWIQGHADWVSLNTDVIGVEVCVALKNLYALAIGMVEGQFKHRDEIEMAFNPTAALSTQSLSEMKALNRYLGGDETNVFSLPGAGDLYVTCQGGRNIRMGRLLGQGLKIQDAQDKLMVDETIEGLELAFSIGATVRSLVQRGELLDREIPLMLHVLDVVLNEAHVDIPWGLFTYST